VTAHLVPGLWTLRLLAFAAASVVLFTLLFLRAIIPVAVIPFVIIAGVDLVGILLVRRWSQRSGWGASHRLALTTGVMGVFIVISPLFEFKFHMTGMLLVNLLALGGLIWLAHRMARWEAAKATSIARANERLSPIASQGSAKKDSLCQAFLRRM
jgi:hypothetical protein